MGRIGRLLQTKIQDFILQTVETRFGLNQLCDQYGPSGEDSPPLPEDRIVLVKIDGTGNYAAVGVLTCSQGAKPGEKILYSRASNGDLKAVMKLLKNGKLDIDAAGDITIDSDATIKMAGGGKKVARKDDQVKVQIDRKSVV